MTYEQIEKEFDEKFLYEYSTSLFDWKRGGVPPMLVKSFLKQSFIKYLQEQLEITKRQQADPFTESEDFLDGFALCKSYTIATLEAQIKELNENK